MRQFLALPPCLGGIELVNTTTLRHRSSKALCEPLVRLILEQQGNILTAQREQKHIKLKTHGEYRHNLLTLAKDLIEQLPDNEQKCVLAAQEKGASSWLTALPLVQHGFSLKRGEFHAMTVWRCAMVGQFMVHLKCVHVANHFLLTMP